MRRPCPPTVGLLHLNLACELGQVRKIAQATRRFLLRQGCGAAEVLDIELALVEACNNAIEYVRPEAAQEDIRLEARCDPGMVELKLSDHTAGFAWPKQVRLPHPEAEGGRGLYLIQAVMDEIQYCRGKTENLLVLRKRRQAADLNGRSRSS